MSKGNVFENELLQLIFNGVAIPNLADNAASSPLTNLYISLHTADPGEAGNQSTSEASYTGYARMALARTAGGWTVTDNSASPTNDVVFPASSAGSGTITYAMVGTAASGAGKQLWRGSLSNSIAIANGIAPNIQAGSTITED